MAAPGIGGRLLTLPLSWLAGVALQLHERALLAAEVHIAIGAFALVALLATALLGSGFVVAVAAALAAPLAPAGC